MSDERWFELVRSLIDSVAEAVHQLAEAAERDDFAALARTAHEARNDALMFGSEALPSALGVVERGGRRADGEAIRDGLAELTEVWPATRAALERALSDRRRAQ